MDLSVRRAVNVVFAGFLAVVVSARGVPAQTASAPMQHTQGERSEMLTLTVGGVSRQISPGDMAKLPQSTLKVHNAHSNRDETYSGVAVADLLASAGLPFSKESQPAFLRSYIRAQGSDFYFVLYSATEVQPELSQTSIIVATQVDGHEIGPDGRFKLVSSGDKRPARWVRNLVSLSLTTLN